MPIAVGGEQQIMVGEPAEREKKDFASLSTQVDGKSVRVRVGRRVRVWIGEALVFEAKLWP